MTETRPKTAKLDSKSSDGLTVYADRSSKQLYIKIISNQGREAIVSILDQTGVLIMEQKVPVNILTFLSLSSLPDGIYVARTLLNNQLVTEKFIY